MNDMGLVPNSGPSGASRQQVMTGGAIKAACEQLIEAMRKENGSYRTYEEMVAENIPTRHVGQHTAQGTPGDPETGQGVNTRTTCTPSSWLRSKSKPLPARPRS